MARRKKSPKTLQPYLWTEGQYALHVNKSIHSVRHDRVNGAGAPYIRIAGAIRYDPQEVEKYLKRNTNRQAARRPAAEFSSVSP